VTNLLESTKFARITAGYCFGTEAIQSDLAALFQEARQGGVEATRFFDAQRRGELVIVRSAADVTAVVRLEATGRQYCP